MRRFLLLISLFAGMGSVHAQSGTLRMRLVDRTGREPVAGAVVELLAQADTTRNPLYTASGGDGEVRLQQVPAGEWLLRVTSLGYKPLARPVRTSGGDEELGTLELTPDAEAIEEVVLEVPALRSSIRGDTLSYRASAFKVTFGADAGALIGKMPGLEIADGVIEAQGRTVQRVFVDGREFFGSDVMSAIRNIPADMVESIDVFNSQGDQSEFTGVDIGDGYTAINIVTQPDKRRGAFGRLFAGYGLTDKYIGGGNVNIFNQSRRLSIIALANNVNIQNFSFEDILGTTDQGQAKARAGSDNFMVRPLEGISTVQAVGVNYSDDWGKRAKITASYFFNRADNRNESLTDRQTFTSTEKLVLYDAQGDSRIENTNHRFNSRFDYRFNDQHSLMMRTAFSIQDYLQQGETFSRTVLFDEAAGTFAETPDPRQSTDYEYDFLTQRAGLSYQYLFRKTKVAASLYYQHVDFSGDYRLPEEARTEASYDNLTYNFIGNIHFNASNLLKINATSQTRNPRATDLQSIVNTTNRQNVFAGNPALRPVYTHDLTAQYLRTNAGKGRTFTVTLRFTASPNTIADSLVIDTPDFVIDDDGTRLGAGNQFVRPVNLAGYWNLRTTLNYGFPVRFLRSNLNLRAGVTTGRIPSIINGTRNLLHGNSYNAGLTLGSNISENIDFKIAYTGYYNISRNSSKVRTVDNDYVNHYLTAGLNLVLGQRFLLRASADYTCYRGITDPFREERLICNLQAGCKLFRQRLGEVTVGVNDLFDRGGTSFRRTVTGTYIRNVTNLGLGRYFLMQFTYNLRLFPRQGAAVTRLLEEGE